MLTVRDNELTVRDDDNVSEEVAEGGHMWESSGNSRGWISRAIWQAGSNLPAFLLTAGTER